MIVVDANIIAYLLIEGEKQDAAQQLRDIDEEWRLPPLWRYEFTNVLTLYVRHRNMPERQCYEILDEAIRLLNPAQRDANPRLALQLALDRGVTGYDAQYLALAEQLDVVGVSKDKQLRSAAPDRVRTMQEFLSDDTIG